MLTFIISLPFLFRVLVRDSAMGYTPYLEERVQHGSVSKAWDELDVIRNPVIRNAYYAQKWRYEIAKNKSF